MAFGRALYKTRFRFAVFGKNFPANQVIDLIDNFFKSVYFSRFFRECVALISRLFRAFFAVASRLCRGCVALMWRWFFGGLLSQWFLIKTSFRFSVFGFRIKTFLHFRSLILLIIFSNQFIFRGFFANVSRDFAVISRFSRLRRADVALVFRWLVVSMVFRPLAPGRLIKTSFRFSVFRWQIKNFD